MKTVDPFARQYPLRALANHKMPCPVAYKSMLDEVPIDRVIPDMSPWIFLPDPERSRQYATAAAGRAVVPFAQAVGHDLVACFIIEESKSPTIVVIDPWSEIGAAQVRAILPDFDAWLQFAKEVSARILAQEQEELDE